MKRKRTIVRRSQNDQPPTRKSQQFVHKLPKGKTPDAAEADLMIGGVYTNALAAVQYTKTLPELSLTEVVTSLQAEVEKVRSGDLGSAEAMLIAQAVTLNAMFTHLVHMSSQMRSSIRETASRGLGSRRRANAARHSKPSQ